jgi:hypothetical protein
MPSLSAPQRHAQERYTPHTASHHVPSDGRSLVTSILAMQTIAQENHALLHVIIQILHRYLPATAIYLRARLPFVPMLRK